ncbi:MAG: segregation/condensation protein A [Planctomycetota bacterium]|nr:segregation/condensation protein A [Planctomycetota bacterium]
MSDEYTVQLERVFQGPMDLLLHLVREQEVEIHEIEIARIVDGYFKYLSSLEKLDIELAGDFLVMAATLMAIKSRSLLPSEEIDLEEDLDPRDELVQRLIEYRRFREASEELQGLALRRAQMFERGWRGELKAADGEERSYDLGDLTEWDLLAIYSRLMRETLADRPHRIAGDPHPLRFYVDHLVKQVRSSKTLSLEDLMASFEGISQRDALVGSFCALLELVRIQVIDVRQDEPGDDIDIAIRPEHAGDIEEVVGQTGLGDEKDFTGPPDPAAKPEGAAVSDSGD